MNYKQIFGTCSIRQKRRDLLGNPLFDRKKIKNATKEEIINIHEEFFKAMNKAMEEVLGESMFDDKEEV